MLDFEKRLKLILDIENQSVVDLYYLDESGFSLSPYIPYGYQPKGVQWEYPSEKKRVKNILGFLNPKTNHLVAYQLPEKTNMNSELFIRYVNNFVAQIDQLTVVVLDNASWHKSNLTRSMFEQWESQGLYFLFLPARAPHLNKIETLWRKIKYEWLSIRDYRSVSTLKRKLNSIFKNYGKDYVINFRPHSFS